jgi:uncharacterized cupin superfamily protein
MVPEASVEETESGRVPQGEGWYVLNAREARWMHSDAFGSACTFEGAARFPDFGVNVHVLQPGQPNCMYHGEEDQEDFLVLTGECLLLVEGEERPLRQWDFVHCPAWTEHVFVGAGEAPCAILMVGGRRGQGIRYPVADAALRHGAGVKQEASDPRDAYAGFDPPEPGPYHEGRLPGLST